MFNILNNNKGTALVGIVIAVVIIAGLAIGSFYLSSKPAGEIEGFESNISNPVKLMDEVEEKIDEFNQTTEERKESLENPDESLSDNGAGSEPINSAGGQKTDDRPQKTVSDENNIILNIKEDDKILGPVRIMGTTTLEVDELTVELRNPEHKALVKETVKVKQIGKHKIFAITIDFSFQHTIEGYIAVYSEDYIVEVPVDYVLKTHL